MRTYRYPRTLGCCRRYCFRGFRRQSLLRGRLRRCCLWIFLPEKLDFFLRKVYIRVIFSKKFLDLLTIQASCHTTLSNLHIFPSADAIAAIVTTIIFTDTINRSGDQCTGHIDMDQTSQKCISAGNAADGSQLLTPRRKPCTHGVIPKHIIITFRQTINMGIVRPIGIKAGSCHLTVTDNSVIIAAQDCKRHFHVSLLLPIIHRKYYFFNKTSIIAKGTVKILGLLLSVRCCNSPELPQIYFMSGSVQCPGKIRHRLCPIFAPVGYGYIRNKLQYPVSHVLLYRSDKLRSVMNLLQLVTVIHTYIPGQYSGICPILQIDQCIIPTDCITAFAGLAANFHLIPHI